jgi:pimeloyl-ACP methyl ester carboxylesterase
LPDTAPTLIFLHEGLGCVEMWRDFPEKLSLATGCGALVYSRLGYGKSDPCKLPLPLTFMHDEGLEVLPELIRKAGIREYILVGHSDGASIALIYAGSAPAKKLYAIIAEAPHVFCEEKTVRQIREAKENYERRGLREKLIKYHGDNVDCAFYGWSESWLNPDFMNWNIEEHVPGITVPMLLIQGKDDEYGTIEHIKRIKQKVAAESLILDGCKHVPHYDQPEATLHAMTDFIALVLKMNQS